MSEGVRLGLDGRARLIPSAILLSFDYTRLYRLCLLPVPLACTLNPPLLLSSRPGGPVWGSDPKLVMLAYSPIVSRQ